MPPVNDTHTTTNRLLPFPQKVCQLQITSALPTVITAAVLPHDDRSLNYRETSEYRDSKHTLPRNSNITWAERVRSTEN
jgi:hypothetical protein